MRRRTRDSSSTPSSRAARSRRRPAATPDTRPASPLTMPRWRTGCVSGRWSTSPSPPPSRWSRRWSPGSTGGAAEPVITFGAPWFLLAGGIAALVPLALHLIRRRPPSRAPLPTARFLSPDPRTSVRVGRPTDLLLLALRMLLLVLAAAAFARPVWRPAARGTAGVVLLDRGAATAGGDAWPRGVAAARQRLLGPRGEALGALVLFDSAASVVPPSR